MTVDQVFECLPLQKLHGNKCQPSLFTDVVDGANIWVVQPGGRLCLSFKPGESLRILGYIVRQKFQRDVTVQPSILTFVDHTHSAPAEFFQHAVVRDGLSDERIGPRHSAAILGCVRRLSQRIAVSGCNSAEGPIRDKGWWQAHGSTQNRSLMQKTFAASEVRHARADLQLRSKG